MPLPTPVKTWQYLVNQPAGGVDVLTSAQSLFLRLKNTLTNTVAHIFNRGNIQTVSGSTHRVYPADTTFSPLVIGNVVGRTMKIRGMTSSANNGNFPITAQTDQGGGLYALEYTNASAVDEAIVGSVNVIGNAFSFPLEMRHSASAPNASSPTVGDGVDRIEFLNDVDHNSNQNTYWVVRNPVTLTEFMMFYGWASSDIATIWARGHTAVCLAPNAFDAPAYNASGVAGVPRGTTRLGIVGNATTEFNLVGLGNPVNTPVLNDTSFLNLTFDGRINLEISSDGEQMRCWVFINAREQYFLMDAKARNPKTAWAAASVPPTVAVFMPPQTSVNINAVVYGRFNDLAQVCMSEIPSPSSGIPAAHGNYAAAYLSAEGYGAATVQENLGIANELTNEWPFFPMGILASYTQYRGRYGLIPDVWWTGGESVGTTFPNTTARNFITVGNWIFPWNGSVAETV